MTDAIVLHAALPLPLSLPWEEPLLQALPYARRLELGRRRNEVRSASLAALALVLMAAERISGRCYPPSALLFPADGKPTLRRGPCFSVSHTELRAACIASLASTCGLDIEEVGTHAESARVPKLERWTATEAALKAAGQGLRFAQEVELGATHDVAVVRNCRFVLQALYSVPGCLGYVASPAGLALSIEAVDLAGPGVSAALQRSLSLPPQFE